MHKGTCRKEYIDGRVMKLSFVLMGRSNAVTYVIGYAPPEASKDEHAKDDFWRVLGNAVDTVPATEQLLVLLDANARTGWREDGGGSVDRKILGVDVMCATAMVSNCCLSLAKPVLRS